MLVYTHIIHTHTDAENQLWLRRKSLNFKENQGDTRFQGGGGGRWGWGGGTVGAGEGQWVVGMGFPRGGPLLL